jgi:hypothetical protein
VKKRAAAYINGSPPIWPKMTDALLPFQPSLASATNTRLDSAARHNQQCRVSTDDMLMFVGHDHDELQRQKYRYCIHKDEFVVGIGRPWKLNASRKRTNNAYPRVISNLGQWDMSTEEKRIGPMLIKYMYHYARSLMEKRFIVNWMLTPEVIPGAHTDENTTRTPVGAANEFVCAELKAKFAQYVPMLTDQVGVGYANTLGWAHPNTGDTMVTVNIGGLRTVMNGDFEIFTGDLIQWYWPFEKNCFLQGGERKPYTFGWARNAAGAVLPPNVNPEYDPSTRTAGTVELDGSAAAREGFYNRGFGDAKRENPKLVARIKPYFRDEENPRIFDAYRVFGVALSCARPHEMVDIKIARQSI